MADQFYAPQFNPQPDVLGQYIRGQMAPLQVQGAQQQLQQGALNLDQLQLAMQVQRARLNMATQETQGLGDAAPGGTPAPQNPVPGGGVQSGPQGSVSSTAPQPQGAPSGYDPSDPLGPLLDPRRLAANARIGQFDATMSGGDPNAPLANAMKIQADQREAMIQRGKLAAEVPSAGNPMPALKAFAGMPPDQAAAALAANPGLMSAWAGLAQKNGADPFDKSKIPIVAALEYNQRGAQYGLSVPVPHPLQMLRAGNQGVAVDPTGEKPPVVFGTQPGYTNQTYTDLQGKQHIRTVETTPGSSLPNSLFGGSSSAPGNGPSGPGPRGGGPGSVVGDQEVGYAAPDKDQNQSAQYASMLRNSLANVRGLENKGEALSPSTRSMIIDAITKEGSDLPLVGTIQSYMQQLGLKKYLSPEEQTYMAGLLPGLEAVAHSQGGMKITTGQLRAYFESLVPVDVNNKPYMDVINSSRNSIYGGLLQRSGQAIRSPLYNNTLGSDFDQITNQAKIPTMTPDQARSAPKGTRFRATDGRILVTR